MSMSGDESEHDTFTEALKELGAEKAESGKGTKASASGMKEKIAALNAAKKAKSKKEKKQEKGKDKETEKDKKQKKESKKAGKEKSNGQDDDADDESAEAKPKSKKRSKADVTGAAAFKKQLQQDEAGKTTKTRRKKSKAIEDEKDLEDEFFSEDGGAADGEGSGRQRGRAGGKGKKKKDESDSEVEADEDELKTWTLDLSSRMDARSGNLRSAFSLKECPIQSIRKLEPSSFIGGKSLADGGRLLYDEEKKANLHFLLGTHAEMIKRKKEQTPADADDSMPKPKDSRDVRFVRWLVKQARMLRTVTKGEVKRGKVGLKRMAAAKKLGSYSLELEANLVEHLNDVNDGVVPEGPVRSEVHFPELKRSDTTVSTHDQRKTLKSKVVTRQASITVGSSHQLDMQKVQDVLTAPSLSWDWDQNDDSESDDGLKIQMPEQAKRTAFKDQLQRSMSAVMAKGLARSSSNLSKGRSASDLQDPSPQASSPTAAATEATSKVESGTASDVRPSGSPASTSTTTTTAAGAQSSSPTPGDLLRAVAERQRAERAGGAEKAAAKANAKQDAAQSKKGDSSQAATPAASAAMTSKSTMAKGTSIPSQDAKANKAAETAATAPTLAARSAAAAATAAAAAATAAAPSDSCASSSPAPTSTAATATAVPGAAEDKLPSASATSASMASSSSFSKSISDPPAAPASSVAATATVTETAQTSSTASTTTTATAAVTATTPTTTVTTTTAAITTTVQTLPAAAAAEAEKDTAAAAAEAAAEAAQTTAQGDVPMKESSEAAADGEPEPSQSQDWPDDISPTNMWGVGGQADREQEAGSQNEFNAAAPKKPNEDLEISATEPFVHAGKPVAEVEISPTVPFEGAGKAPQAEVEISPTIPFEAGRRAMDEDVEISPTMPFVQPQGDANRCEGNAKAFDQSKTSAEAADNKSLKRNFAEVSLPDVDIPSSDEEGDPEIPATLPSSRSSLDLEGGEVTASQQEPMVMQKEIDEQQRRREAEWLKLKRRKLREEAAVWRRQEVELRRSTTGGTSVQQSSSVTVVTSLRDEGKQAADAAAAAASGLRPSKTQKKRCFLFAGAGRPAVASR